MAFPSSRKVAWDRFNSLTQEIKSRAVRDRSTMANGAVAGSVIFALIDNLRAIRSEMLAIAAVPGIAAYAKAQHNDANLDIVTEGQAVIDAIEAVGVAAQAVFSLSADDYIENIKWGALGARSERTFPAVETANLRSALDTLAATVA